MLKKIDIINAVNEFESDEVDLYLLQDKLQLLQKIEQAEGDVQGGRIYTTDQLKENIDSWRQSYGQKLPKAI